MKSGNGRLLARSIRDVTNVTTEDLRIQDNNSPHLISDRNLSNEVLPAKAQVICIASGKGGTGKTVVTTNLALALAKEGLRVLLFDADLGLANAHLLMGASPTHDVSAVLSGEKKMSEIKVTCFEGVELISGGSGFSNLAEIKDGRIRYMADELKTCEDEVDMVLVDLSAGISPQVMRFLEASHDIILVTTPDVTAMVDAYATVKALRTQNTKTEIKLIINRAKDRNDATSSFKRIVSIAAKHLGETGITFFGWIPQNWYVQDSVNKRHPVVLLHPKSFVTGSLKTMAKKLKSNYNAWTRDKKENGNVVESFSSKLRKMVF